MNDNTDTLLARWKSIVENIVAFEYDCSFEWHGETDGSHDSYLADLKRLEQEAGEALRQALDTGGADRAALLERAGEVCRKMEAEGGWGSSRCWASISHAS